MPSALRKSREGGDCFDDADMNAIGCGNVAEDDGNLGVANRLVGTAMPPEP